MNIRSKIVWIVVVACLGALVLYQVASWLIIEPWSEELKRGRTVAEKAERADAMIGKLGRFESEWRQLGERTYFADRAGFKLELQKQLRTLVCDRAGLDLVSAAPVVKLTSDLTPTNSKDLPGVEQIAAEINGRGSMQDVAKAIYLLYHDNRLGRLDRVQIKPVPAARADAKPEYQLSVGYTAFFLSSQNPSTQFKVTPTDKLPPSRRLEPPDWTTYADMSRRTLFDRYTEPPPAAPVAPVVARPVETQPARVVPPREPPKPPGFTRWVVTGVYESELADGKRELSANIADGERRWSVKTGEKLADGVVSRIDMDRGYLVLAVGNTSYVIEARSGRTFGDRVRLEDFRVVTKLNLQQD